jgi:hypothetical protein
MMTVADWAMLIATILGIASTLLMGLRWLVKSFLYELKPNGGSSMKDKVNVLEDKVDLLTELVKEALRK